MLTLVDLLIKRAILANTTISIYERKSMAKTRALLTDTERRQLAGEEGDERKYQATSRVRRRINEELTTDIDVLRKHHPDLFSEIQSVVCEEDK